MLIENETKEDTKHTALAYMYIEGECMQSMVPEDYRKSLDELFQITGQPLMMPEGDFDPEKLHQHVLQALSRGYTYGRVVLQILSQEGIGFFRNIYKMIPCAKHGAHQNVLCVFTFADQDDTLIPQDFIHRMFPEGGGPSVRNLPTATQLFSDAMKSADFISSFLQVSDQNVEHSIEALLDIEKTDKSRVSGICSLFRGGRVL